MSGLVGWLVCVVPSFAKVKNGTGGWRECSGVMKSEIGKSRFPKHVPIFNPSVDVDSSCCGANLSKFDSSQRTIKPQSLVENGALAEIGVERVMHWGNDQRVLICHRNNGDLRPTHNVIGRVCPEFFISIITPGT